MLVKAASTFLLILAIAAAAFSQERARVAVFLNPYKWCIGLWNVGLELQYDESSSVVVSMEYAGVRTGYLERIGHPDLVATVGLRRYASAGSPVADGAFAGVTSSLWYGKPRGGRGGWLDCSLGIEAGSRLFVGDSFHVLPRGLMSYTLRGRRLLPGAEVSGGVLP